MFIRKRQNKSGSTSIQIVQKIGKSLKILEHVGTANTFEDISELIKKANALITSQNISLFQPSINLDQIQISGTKLIGFHEVFGHIYDEIGYETILQDQLIRDLVIARIARPTSKLGTFRWLKEKVGLVNLEKDQIYRSMDSLDKEMEQKITDHTFSFIQNTLGTEINIIFFDATTLHFKTFESDTLRRPGFSKVGKHNQPQIIIGLMVTKDGLPIGYDVYPGNQFDGHTIRSALRRVSRRYKVKDVIFIADNAMMSKDNIALLEQSNFKYIMAARIKSMSNEMKGEILDDSKYKNNIFETGYKGNQRLVVSYSRERARKDRSDREKNIGQIKKRLTKRSRITKTKLGKIGRSKYLLVDGEAEVSINYKAVQADEVWDGLKGYLTNIPKEQLSAHDVIQKYSELWQVEKAFRVSKSELNIRPVYHYRRERIRAHILIVFMSLVISRYTEQRLKELQMTTARLIELLETVIVVKVSHPNSSTDVVKKVPLSEKLTEVYNLFKING